MGLAIIIVQADSQRLQQFGKCREPIEQEQCIYAPVIYPGITRCLKNIRVIEINELEKRNGDEPNPIT